MDTLKFFTLYGFMLAIVLAGSPARAQDLDVAASANESGCFTEAAPITTEAELLAAGGRPIPASLAPRPVSSARPRASTPSAMDGPPFVPSIEHPEVGEIYRYVNEGWRFVGNGVLIANGHTIVTAAHVLRFHTGEIPTGRYRIEFTNVGLPLESFDIVQTYSFTTASPDDPESPRSVLDDIAIAQLTLNVPPEIATPARVATGSLQRGTPVSRVTHGPVASFAGDGAHAPRHYFDETWGTGLSTLIVLGDSGGGLFLGSAQANGDLFALSTALLQQTRQNVFIPLAPFLVRFASVSAAWLPPLSSLEEFDADPSSESQDLEF